MRRPASAQLLLGGRGLHLQVLRGGASRPHAQGHPPRRQDQLDLQGGDEASRAARTDLGQQELARSGQGPRIQQDHR